MNNSPAEGPRELPARDAPAWRFAVGAAGWGLLALGAVALLAWALGEPDYLQLDPLRTALHYNAALGFLVWGGAYLALYHRRERAARALAWVLVLSGVAILCLSVLGTGVRLDRWAFVPSPSALPYPGTGLTPALALGFVLGGAALLLVARSGGPVHVLAGALIGVFLAASGIVALTIAPWNAVVVPPSGPAVLGVLGSVVAAVPLLMVGFRRGANRVVLGHAVPVAVGVAGIALTTALWAALSTEQNRRINRQVQYETAQAQRLVLERLSIEVNRVAEQAEKWPDARAGDPIPNHVKLDVGGYLGGTPGCVGVARIDEQFGVTWIETYGQQPPTFADLGGGEALTEAVRTGQVAVVRPPRSYWRGTRVLLIFAPHREKGTGGFVSAISVQQFYATIFNVNAAPGYAVTVTEGEDVVFTRYGAHQTSGDRWNQSLPLRFRGREWRLAVSPTQDALARERLSLPKLALLTGLFTTALLVLAVHLAQTARRRTSALENEMRERKLAEQAMRVSEQKYRTLIENLGQGIFLQDQEHRYVAANLQFCKSVGRGEAEVIGATDPDLFDPERAARYVEEVRTVLAEGRSVESESEVLVGERRTCVRRVLTPVHDATGATTGVLGICWDVTEQRQLEAHVNQASKMDAIGQLAGGIAHDFNNLLTVILGNLEMMLGDADPAHPDHGLIVSAQSAATRAAALTQRLLGFSRRHQLDWRPTNLNAVVAEVVALLHRTIDPLIRIETDLDPGLWAVESDPTLLNQVLMNLCINARDAIGGAGLIAISTDCVTGAQAPGAVGASKRRGEYVRLRVTDTGAGIPPEVKARIYEPFFTTKSVGKGTGLGLAMVFAIVRQHKGWIECTSEVGEGTRFDVYLPRGVASKAEAVSEITPAPPRRSGQATVLVVDDEELIRNLATITLQRSGYRVLQAADGQQAVDLYAKHKDRIDIVILDLTMPVLSGHEAFRLILGLNARAQVLLASGYSAEQLSELEKEQMAGFVKKPYSPNELVQVVEEALLRRGSHPDAPVAVARECGPPTAVA